MYSLAMYIVFVIVCVCCPSIMVIPIVLAYISANKVKRVVPLSFGMAWIWGIAGYCFINPRTDPDIVRYLSILSEYNGKTLLESFNLTYNNLYVVDIYFHFISRLHNPQMLPAISVFLFYFILFYVFLDYKIKTNINNKNFIVYMLFALSAISFPVIVNGIRWPVACMVFFLAFYREVVQNKKSFFTFILYVIPVFMHFSMLVFVALRLAILIRNKKIALIVTLFSGMIPTFFNILSRIVPSASSNFVIGNLVYFVKRGNMYFQWKDTDSGWAEIVSKSGYYKFESYFYIAIVIIFFLILYVSIRAKRNRDIGKENMFVFYLMIITILTFPMAGHIYIRFVTPMIVCFCLCSFKFYKLYENSSLRTVFNSFLLGFLLIGIYLNIHLLGSMVDVREYLSNIFVFGVFNLFF